MSGRAPRMPFVLQLVVTALIIVALAGAAHLASDRADARAFDEAAEETRDRYGMEDRGEGRAP